MIFDHGDLVVIERGGNPVGEALGAFDPALLVLYLPEGADVAEGDAITLRGSSYRIKGDPEVWVNPWTGWDAGIAAHLELVLLPDQAVLERAGPPVWDRDLNTQVPGWVTIWTGPVLVETPPSVAGIEAPAAEQRLTLMPMLVTAPLELIDVQPDDRLTVLSSRDPFLVGRRLEVTRIRGGSGVNLRQFSVIDNQG
jgi:hypothetical protein